MHIRNLSVVLTAALLSSTAIPAFAAPVFNRIASFPVELNAPDAEATSSEIITATDDGMMLIYSDSPNGGIGFIDLTDAKAPKPAGYMDMGGEPTSVTVIGAKAYVAVNTRKDFVDQSGKLVVVDIATKTVDGEFQLGGQPDSIAHNKAGTILAIAIENERDESVNDGDIPQLPSGYLVLVNLVDGKVTEDGIKKVELSGLSDIAPEDAEVEFVAFNDNDEVAVTLQENNWIAIVDAKTGTVTGGFTAGATSVDGIDTKNDGTIDFAGSKKDLLREPDAIKWLDADRLVVANEGDWKGGSRGFTIFNRDGSVNWDSGNALDVMAAQMGHYPDQRNKKGVEPEGLEVATIGDSQFIFVAEERSSLIAIYKDVAGAAPEYLQSVASGIGPEGLIAIPARNLLITANENDLRADSLAGSHVMIYELAEGTPAYPQIVSDMDADGHPIGWAALSGAVSDAEKPGTLYVVSDSALYNAPAIYTVDATQTPAHITAKTIVTRDGNPAQKLDLEGITLDGEGGFWLASEGDTAKLVPHALYHVDAEGAIMEEVAYPAELLAGEIRSGSEGITSVGTGDDMTLWIAIQREWKDDPKGQLKLVSYKPSSKEWGAVRYPLETPAEGAWVGLSEITVHGDYAYIIERDNQASLKAKLKAIYRVPVSELVGAPLGGELPVVTKELVRDLVPDLQANNGYVADKVESFTIDAAGNGFVITDNDGVDDSSGETFFWSIGEVK
ncbi:MAG: Alkaline phosphatase [Devosia sp.]|uniref:esterase-like activity of phytase family protein n=1 Tax=Devosia sp. TaxID=1871048 RepID=UPI002611E985|nr:esterase-like activity of phytase family protein [Devosia sp.]MDB5527071.1 Alkaline phosphatase [Devosia sp.]